MSSDLIAVVVAGVLGIAAGMWLFGAALNRWRWSRDADAAETRLSSPVGGVRRSR